MGIFLALTLLACVGWGFFWWTRKPEPKQRTDETTAKNAKR